MRNKLEHRILDVGVINAGSNTYRANESQAIGENVNIFWAKLCKNGDREENIVSGGIQNR